MKALVVLALSLSSCATMRLDQERKNIAMWPEQERISLHKGCLVGAKNAGVKSDVALLKCVCIVEVITRQFLLSDLETRPYVLADRLSQSGDAYHCQSQAELFAKPE
jgi:hypothetical protein